MNPREVDDDPCLKALLVSAYLVFPDILHAAIHSDLFGIISSQGDGAFLSASEVASLLPSRCDDTVDILDRMMRCLSSHSLLCHKTVELKDGRLERRYGITPAGRYFCRGEDGGSIASICHVAMHHATRDAWMRVTEAVAGGGNLFLKVHGKSIFQYMKEDPQLNTYFNNAMADLSAIQTRKILEVYDGFEGITTLVDVGGGKGATLHAIISKYPSIKGINFDLPQVIEHAPAYPGIEHVGGDMFVCVPKGGDAILIKCTCHNWSDESCIKFLKNCYDSLPPKGKVVIIDFIMPEEPEESNTSKLVTLLDNRMLLQPGGKERTEKQFQGLCKGAGFSEFRVAARAISALGAIEFLK
ncbi:hypothetical protein MLD38_033683 [Melastoma candidum]|uniref:Uncharacterized protein n=1 Tax=Melastoma candidum TaxID=119954 RepID=A0ACB9M9P0_9MYRT|nr:hypothetical protein MLD38_033683 [Melastoma candidum]